MKMAYTPKPGSFSLFKNDRKESDNHPDYKGDGMDIDGNPIWVSAWVKESTKGKFFSCSFKLKDPQPESKAEKPAPAKRPYHDIDDADLPF
jgi:hypothetical protein